jgi:hypothetical protein
MKNTEKQNNINAIFAMDFSEIEFAAFALDCHMVGETELSNSLLYEFFRSKVLLDHRYDKKYSFILERELHKLYHSITVICVTKWNDLMEFYSESFPTYDLEYTESYDFFRIETAADAVNELNIDWGFKYNHDCE